MHRQLYPLFLLQLLVAGAVVGQPSDEPVLWPEAQRAFLQDGPGLLLTAEQREGLLGMGEAGREAWIEGFLARDPIPDTPDNELQQGIRRRQRLAHAEFLSFVDDRTRLLFLHGAPDERITVDCDMTFKRLEIWRYGDDAGGGRRLVLFQPALEEPYRLWLPLDSKRALYTQEMEYWLEQWEELRGRISGKRFDLQICSQARLVDEVTGVRGLFGFAPNRPTTKELSALLEAPGDLAEWAREAAATPLPEEPAELALDQVELLFPEQKGQRMVARLLLVLPAGSQVERFTEDGKDEVRLNVDGVIERQGRLFEDFRVRFQVQAPAPDQRLALVLERLLRPGETFLMRLKLEDEVGGAQVMLSRGFLVPREPQPVDEPPVPDEVIVALGERLAVERMAGADSLILVPPETDVVLGLWRADVLVTGERISKVKFLVDGTVQMTRRRPPFSAELRLTQYPTEQVIRAEGYDGNGEFIAADEVVVNQQRGELRVRIVEPRRGGPAVGKVMAQAEIVVPEERRVAQVEFLINDVPQVTLKKPPWQTELDVAPPTSAEEITYLTVVAQLDDGSRAEDVRFLNVPNYLEEVEVDLVELYTTVTDRSRRLVRGLSKEDFTVLEDDRPQEISKFELVENLPLTLGITIDTSGSMIEALGEARQTAIDFLHNIITPRDRSFAVSFANHPILLMPRTSDVGAVEESLENLQAVGMTSLYDAVVTSLYYFRGVRGRRALVLLSDGEDTASTIPYRDALEYARRSGVAIFTIGLNISSLQFAVRDKLSELSKETGGRSFYINKAVELAGVYKEIEDELRSQYLLAYTSDRPKVDESFREVEVKVRGKLKARTIRGYYP